MGMAKTKHFAANLDPRAYFNVYRMAFGFRQFGALIKIFGHETLYASMICAKAGMFRR